MHEYSKIKLELELSKKDCSQKEENLKKIQEQHENLS